ncbi:uncharacterized protein LOC132796304 isoform X1 [Drosophila nasuta]|uniref:uncharacterized protein LOC132796304 isoform X1 n=2 Tax=Drosophila nasuta TaxID=42062 RepID=UPI00295F4128|nr:uncharacterized protein LOC132796304 isoform X1 [Drosophila nasuta]
MCVCLSIAKYIASVNRKTRKFQSQMALKMMKWLAADAWLGLALALAMGFSSLPLAEGGSCREAQLCCNGRDSSCVVQKAPINAIIEDLSDKPCYCDHACLKLGDCCDDFKDHCGVLDCQVGEWGAWGECDKSCGSGMMQRTRQILQAAQNGGKHCPTLLQKRACQGYRCHGHRDKKILREMALLLPASLSHSHSHNTNESSELRRNLRTRYRDSYKHNRDHEYCVEFEVIKASKACHKLPPYNLMLEGDRITVRCDLEALIQDKEQQGSSSSGGRGASTMTTTSTTTTTTTSTHKAHGYLMEDGGDESKDISSSSSGGNNNDNEDNEEEQQQLEEDDSEEEDAQNMLETEAEMGLGMGMGTGADAETETGGDSESSSNEQQLKRQRQSHRSRSATSTASKRSSNSNSKSATVPAMPQSLQLQQQLPLSYHCRGEGLSGRTTRWSALAAPSCRGKWLRLTIGPPKKCNHAQFIFI